MPSPALDLAAPPVAAPPVAAPPVAVPPVVADRDRTTPLLRRDQVPPFPSRTLTARELKTWVDAFAPQAALWQDLVAHGGGRHFASLYRDDHLDVWLLCWDERDDTGWHDHDLSSGAVAVTRGAVREGRLRFGRAPVTRRVPAGRSFCFGPDRIHRVSGGVDGSVSVHAYSPPLVRLGQYTMTRSGVLQRVSVGYTEELRDR